MTEYGRGYRSQPWHPEDPLYGEQRGPQDPYGGGQYQAPQQGYDGAGLYEQYSPQGHDPQQAYAQHGDPQGYGQQGYDPQAYDPQAYDLQGYGTQGYAPQVYGDPGHGPQGYAPGEGGGAQQPYDPAYGMGATDPYGMPPVDPYGDGRPVDFYTTPDAYPPPQPQHMRAEQPQEYHPGAEFGQVPDQGLNHGPGPEQGAAPGPGFQPGYGTGDETGYGGGPGPDPDTGWDPGPDRGEYAFFARRDDDEDADWEEAEDDPGTGGRKGRRGSRTRRGGAKRRSGRVLLAASLVLAGGVAVGGYFGYDFYTTHLVPPPDFQGKGTGEVQVEIPDQATISDMGNVLKREGVVKSHDAFVAAATEGGGDRIQSGTYTLRKQMSASEAVDLMLDPASKNTLIIPEGARNSQVYTMIDKKIGLKKGTTKKVAKEKSGSLGLPSWSGGAQVKDPLEGFLYPSRYTVGEDTGPEDVLKNMVARAEKRYETLGLTSRAEEVGLDSPLEVLSVASLVQAEGRTHDDFRKMSEVVYNRLRAGNTETNGMLEFDSTYNYIKNQSEIDLTIAELRNYDNPYNTYFYEGLPPGPIGNPGDDALRAALNPDDGGWYYFISLDGKTSKFTKTYKEHKKLVEEFRRLREEK